MFIALCEQSLLHLKIAFGFKFLLTKITVQTPLECAAIKLAVTTVQTVATDCSLR